MGDHAKGDIVKTQDKDMHTEHETSSDPVVDPEAIALLAYYYWEARGCPHDSPDEDWFRAEAEFRNRLVASATE
jgi:hypothetical protein